jgi:hypothetical protein
VTGLVESHAAEPANSKNSLNPLSAFAVESESAGGVISIAIGGPAGAIGTPLEVMRRNPPSAFAVEARFGRDAGVWSPVWSRH